MLIKLCDSTQFIIKLSILTQLLFLFISVSIIGCSYNPVVDLFNDEPEVFGPDPATDNITYTLPKTASDLQLSLPADLSDIFYDDNIGVCGFGVHAGGHIEGLDHVWIVLKAGIPAKSWADGTVEKIGWIGDPKNGEYFVTIDYGHNLIGTHMEVIKPYVKEGDKVKRGQPIGMGMGAESGVASAEFALVDEGRHTGVEANKGVYVSPYDYLEDGEKKRLVEAYKKNVLDRYKATGENPSGMFSPYQPYLSNEGMLHIGNKGKLTGEWLYSGKWEIGYPNDILTFIEADNPYYKGNIVLAMDDESYGGSMNPWELRGTYEVDYTKGQVKIDNGPFEVYYGIFEIDKNAKNPTLIIEYQKGTYPISFSEKALEYISRPAMPRRWAAQKMGMLKK